MTLRQQETMERSTTDETEKGPQIQKRKQPAVTTAPPSSPFFLNIPLPSPDRVLLFFLVLLQVWILIELRESSKPY